MKPGDYREFGLLNLSQNTVEAFSEHFVSTTGRMVGGNFLLERQAARLPIARQILAGEFDGADRSTRESLEIGFRSIAHPVCQRALKQVQTSGE